MKNSLLRKILVQLVVLLPVFTIADPLPIVEIRPDYEYTNHSPEYLNRSYQYSNRIIVFNPLHQCYERIKPNAMYFGVDAWATIAIIDGNYKLEDLKLPRGIIGEVEIRGGYNFFYNGEDHLTAFLGAGLFNDWTKKRVKNEEKRSFLPPIAYGAFGFLYDHEFNTVFNLGLNLKAMFGDSIKKKNWNIWKAPIVGLDAALPITFRLGAGRHWDLRIEPFDIYLYSHEISRNYFGFRGSIGIRF